MQLGNLQAFRYFDNFVCVLRDQELKTNKGLCMTSNNVPIVHLPNFHQAKWDEYSEGYLDNNTPLSFHKHYGLDPIQVYANWFGLDDQQWWSTQAHDHPSKRDELWAQLPWKCPYNRNSHKIAKKSVEMPKNWIS